MKTRNFQNRDFSTQFDGLTLAKMIAEYKKEQRVAAIESTILNKVEALLKRDMNKKYKYDFLLEFFEGRAVESSCRYVWHLSSGFDDIEIANKGLLTSETQDNAIYANNGIYPDTFFPFFDDPFYGIEDLSFWRIDTCKIDVEWRMDTRCSYECEKKCYGCNRRCSALIRTLSDIPPSALQLFYADCPTFDSEYEWKNRTVDSLIPNTMINDHIAFANKRRAA